MSRSGKSKAVAVNYRATRAVLFASLLFSGCLLLMIAFATSAKAYNFPQCDDSRVEARIFTTFAWAERKTWQRGIDLVSLSRIHEHRTTQFEGSIMSRRYCMAHGHFSDGKKRPVYFMINDRGGFAGQSWNVTQCVIGLDPWKNHDGNCLAIR